MVLTDQTATFSRTRTLPVIVLVVASLYFAREVLIPIALAVLLSFLLAPVASFLQRWHLGRIPAALGVVILAFTLFGVLGWVVAGQLLNLAKRLPEYKHNIQAKIKSVQRPLGKNLDKSSATVRELSQQFSTAQPGESNPLARPGVTQVEIVEPPPNALQFLRSALGPVVKPLGTAAIVIVLVVFMLLKREDLRDRLVYMIGSGHLYATTQALDDAACRVSRYLLMQSIINGSQGIAVGIGLFLIGVPNAVVWGLLSALLRFIPYVGPWIAALAPIAVSLATFDDWTRPLLTLGLFVVLELISNNFLEPWLYGASIGVSPLALMVAAVFWTWLWGNVGLVLSAPLTVCLVVMGRYIPQLEFLSTLLGDQPVLEPKSRFYQRLLAMDQEEASEVVDQYLKKKQLVEACDTILVPALGLAEQDRHRGVLDESRERFVFESVTELIEELCEGGKQTEVKQTSSANGQNVGKDLGELSALAKTPSISVLCLPAQDKADEITAMLFVRLLEMAGVQAQFVSVTTLAGEMMDLVEQHEPDVVCISALPPAAVRQACYLCKRLRARFPKLHIVVGLWDAQGDRQKAKERIESAGTNNVVATLAEGLEEIRRLNQSSVLCAGKPGTPLQRPSWG